MTLHTLRRRATKYPLYVTTFAGNLGVPARELKAGRRVGKLNIRSATPALSIGFVQQPGRTPNAHEEKQQAQQPLQGPVRARR